MNKLNAVSVLVVVVVSMLSLVGCGKKVVTDADPAPTTSATAKATADANPVPSPVVTSSAAPSPAPVPDRIENSSEHTKKCSELGANAIVLYGRDASDGEITVIRACGNPGWLSEPIGAATVQGATLRLRNKCGTILQPSNTGPNTGSGNEWLGKETPPLVNFKRPGGANGQLHFQYIRMGECMEVTPTPTAPPPVATAAPVPPTPPKHVHGCGGSCSKPAATTPTTIIYNFITPPPAPSSPPAASATPLSSGLPPGDARPGFPGK